MCASGCGVVVSDGMGEGQGPVLTWGGSIGGGLGLLGASQGT